MVAAVALAVLAFLYGWSGNRGVSAGLWGIQVCGDGCQSIRWDNVPGGFADLDVLALGYGGFVLALVTSALALFSAMGRSGLLPMLAKLARATFVVLAVFLIDLLARNFNPGVVGVAGVASALVIWRAALAKV